MGPWVFVKNGWGRGEEVGIILTCQLDSGRIGRWCLGVWGHRALGENVRIL